MPYYLVSPTVIARRDASAFTYHASQTLPVGSLVLVELGKRTVPAVVLRHVAQPTFTVKPILRQLTTPPLPTALLQTAQWLSEYYHTHPATVWQAVLPRSLSRRRRQPLDQPPITPVNDAIPSSPQPPMTLTKQQRHALQVLSAMSPGTALLHGVTGSGKTMVYIELARQVLQQGRSVILLVPEIALTSQLVETVAQHLGTVVLTHSAQGEAMRYRTWHQVLHARHPQIIIGPRSALFMPVQRLGLIVIDECHEPSFKQEQAPRYSALRTAAILAQQHQAKLVLGSATPSVTDYYLAQQAGRPIVTLSTPARRNTIKPTVTVVAATDRQQFTRHPILSNRLLTTLEQTIAAGQQALIFHNRRGTATTSLCSHCGWQAGCPRCFVPLTLHADRHQLVCHVCHFTTTVPTSCPTCQSIDILHQGIGTKRIEAALHQLFPRQRIARFDADTTATATVDRRYHELKSGQIDLIIGTQVVAKGLDLPHLRCVGVVQADAGLNLPDFAAAERTFQLLAQVVGRVGRSHHATDVVVQTYQPSHPAIQDGLSQQYNRFYQRTLAQRQASSFPPFVHLLQLTCSYKTESTAIAQAKSLSTTLRRLAPPDMQLLGPTPAFYERVRDHYRWQLLLKSPHRHHLVDMIEHLPSQHWHYNLDPISLL